MLDPRVPAVQVQARRDGVPEAWIEAALRSPIYKLAKEWKVAFPLHPEYRTLPMVWYVPPLSPIQSAAEAGRMSVVDGMPDVRSLRIPMRYLANLLTAGDEAPVVAALERMLAMRAYMRSKNVEGRIDESIAERVGLTSAVIEEMYRIMALAAYEDRYVIPTAHREFDEDVYKLRGATGFAFREGTEGRSVRANLFGGPKGTPRRNPNMDIPT
jgi:nitrate reductase beta subunit